MKAIGHKSIGYCGSSAQKTETKTNTKNCGPNFSAVLSSKSAAGSTNSKCLPPPHKGHAGHSGHGGSHHNHAISHHGHTSPFHGKHAGPHLGCKAFHKGLSLSNSKPCSSPASVKPPVSSGTNAAVQMQKTLQLTVQSQTYMAVNYSSYSSYSVANAVGSNLHSLGSVNGYNFKSGTVTSAASKTSTAAFSMTRTDRFFMGTNTLVSQHGYKISDLVDKKTGNLCPAKLKSAYQKHGLTNFFDGLNKEWELEYKIDMTYQITMLALMDAAKNKMNDEDSMLSFYKMLMENFIENKSEGAVSLDDLYVENGKIMGLPPILDKIINGIETAQSANPDEKPDDAKSVLKEILKKGVKNIPDLTINIAIKNDDGSSAKAA